MALWPILVIVGGGIGWLGRKWLAASRPKGSAVTSKGGPMPLIKLGSSGPAVETWRVSVLGLPAGQSFDTETDAATKAWQKKHDLAADGIVGRRSWEAAGYSFQSYPRTPSAPASSAASSLDASAATAGDTSAGGGSGGHAWAKTLPLEGVAAQPAILAAFRAGEYVHTWVPLMLTDDHGNTLEIEVSARALRIGTHDDSVSVIVTPSTLQAMADDLGAYMLTSHVADAIHHAADLRILPYPGRNNWVQDGTMGHTDRMVEHSDALDAKGVLSANLVSNEGKDWITSVRFWTDPEPKKHNDANYGFFQDEQGHPVQSEGLMHKNHTDYSQKARFMRKRGRLNGSDVDLRDVVRDPATAGLLSSFGRMPDLKHPDAGGAQS